MNPTLDKRIYYILALIYDFIDQKEITMDNDEKNPLFLFCNLLIMDISPCLKKGLLIILSRYFRIYSSKKEKILANLEKDGFSDVIMFSCLTTNIDIKIYLIDLINTISKYEVYKSSNNKENIYNFKIFPFLKQNLIKNQSNEINFTHVNFENFKKILDSNDFKKENNGERNIFNKITINDILYFFKIEDGKLILKIKEEIIHLGNLNEEKIELYINEESLKYNNEFFYKSLIHWLLNKDFYDLIKQKENNQFKKLIKEIYLKDSSSENKNLKDAETTIKDFNYYSNSDKTKDDYLITNPEVLEIIIQYIQTTDIMKSYEFLIEINEIIYLNFMNVYILGINENFFNWQIEILFSSFILYLRNDKENKLIFNDKLKDIYSLFILGKKILIKIITDFSINFSNDVLPIKINNLFNWAMNMKHFRNLEYEDIELNAFFIDILNDLFDNFKEKLDQQESKFDTIFTKIFQIDFNKVNFIDFEKLKILKENYFKNPNEINPNNLNTDFRTLYMIQKNLNNNWLNIVNYSFLFYEYITFFNLSKNQTNFFDRSSSLELSNEKKNIIPSLIEINSSFSILENYKISNINNNKNNSNEFESDIDNQIKFKKDIEMDNHNYYSLYKNTKDCLRDLNRNLIKKISKLWIESNIFSKKKNENFNVLEEEKLYLIDFCIIENIIEKYVFEKENKNAYFFILQILSISDEFNLNKFQKNHYKDLSSLLRDENILKLYLFEDDIKMKIKSIFSVKKLKLLSSKISDKEKIGRYREHLNYYNKIIFDEFKDVIDRVNLTDMNQVNDLNANIKNNQNLDSKTKKINLFTVINNIFILNIENIKKEIENSEDNFSIDFNNKDENKNNILFWLSNYQKFLIFIIIASMNLKSKNFPDYTELNNTIIESILFSLIYLYDILLDNFNHKEKNKEISLFFFENVEVFFKNIFSFLLISLEKIDANKRKKSVITKLINNKSKKDLLTCSVYRIFTEVFTIANENNNNLYDSKSIFSDNFLDDFKKLNSKQIYLLLKNIKFDDLINNQDFRNKRSNKMFNLDYFLNIISMRNKEAELITQININFIFKNFRTTNLLLYDISNKSNKEKVNVYNEDNKSNSKKSKLEMNAKNSNDLINHKILKKNLDEFEKRLENYDNEIIFEKNNLKLNWNKNKKKLFLWDELWSNKKIFYGKKSNDGLNYKMMNHITKTFSRPILKSIINVDENFSLRKFGREEIFISNSKGNYESFDIFNESLSLDLILSTNELDFFQKNYTREEKSISNQEEIKEGQPNYYFYHYLHENRSLWNKYTTIKKISDKIIHDFTIENFKEISYNDKISFLNILETKYNIKDFKHIYNIFEICLVKTTIHINCHIKISNNGIHFYTNSLNEKLKNLQKERIPHFDDTKGDCYGSFIKYNANNKYIKHYRVINFKDIQYIFKRNYYLKNTAIEIFFCNKSYYIVFYSKEDRKKFLNIAKATLLKCRKIKVDNINPNNLNYSNMFDIQKFNKNSRKESNLSINEKNTQYNDRSSSGFTIASEKKEKKRKKKKLITIGYENCNLKTSSIFNCIEKKIKKDDDNKELKQNEEIKKCEKYKSIKISDIFDSWSTKNYFSNFDLLLIINIIANRSFIDVTQYPIFPWIIRNYENINIEFEKKFKDSKILFRDIRDLSLPMGMLHINEESTNFGTQRKNTYVQNFKSTLEDYKLGESEDIPYFYGSMYSNLIYVAHYLIRIFPFTKLAIEFQGGKFDCFDRLFRCFQESFNNANKNIGDVRELIPEFFYLPEILININNLELDKDISRDKDSIKKNLITSNIDKYDVELPKWSQGNPYLFVSFHKEAMESAEISFSLSEWIDLIFGYKQSGKMAIEAKNLFFSSAYLINLEDFKLETLKIDEQHLKMKFLEFGLIPKQIINKKINNKIINEENLTNIEFKKSKTSNIKNKSNINSYFDEKHWRVFCFSNLQIFNKGKYLKQMIKIKIINKDKLLLCLYNDNSLLKIKINNSIESSFLAANNFKKNSNEIIQIVENINIEDCFLPFSHKMHEFYEVNNINDSDKVNYISKNGKFVVQAGYYDGGIRIIQLDGEIYQNLKIYMTRNIANVYLHVDNNENYAFVGSLNGLITIFSIEDNFKKWEKIKEIKDHRDKILCVNSNDYLNIFASSSLDGFINLFTCPQWKIFRSIRINDDKLNFNPIANNIFISSSPLPCVCFYSNQYNKFYSYSINGTKISEVEKTVNKENKPYNSNELEMSLLESSIISDSYFNNFLLYLSNDHVFEVRKFPFLNLVENKIENLIKNKTSNQIQSKPIKFCLNENKKKILYYDESSLNLNVISEII